MWARILLWCPEAIGSMAILQHLWWNSSYSGQMPWLKQATDYYEEKSYKMKCQSSVQVLFSYNLFDFCASGLIYLFQKKNLDKYDHQIFRCKIQHNSFANFIVLQIISMYKVVVVVPADHTDVRFQKPPSYQTGYNIIIKILVQMLQDSMINHSICGQPSFSRNQFFSHHQ